MIPTFKTLGIATLVLVVLDLIWVGVLMAPFYQSKLRPILNFVDGTLHPRIPALIITYVTMILLVSCVAVPLMKAHSSSGWGALAIGAFLGLLVYGLYNFTNLSLLKDWNTTLAFVDTVWGGVLFGLATFAVWFFL